jgi:RimJ/RimL family protein N-acetyltransferase
MHLATARLQLRTHRSPGQAGMAIRDYAFRARAPPRVISLIRPENGPSQRVARRLGMEPAELVQFAGLDHLVFSVRSPARA